MFDLKQHLNPSQLEAVNATNGPVLVIAGAGSGKTRVIEYRVLHLVKSGVDPRTILLLTFTREAARRMLSRATKHDPECTHVEGGTFHSFAYKVLKKYCKVLGFQESFSILDEADAHEALRKCASELGLSDKKKRFPKGETLKDIISVAINKGIPLPKVIEHEYEHFLDDVEAIERVRKRYVEYKLEKNYLDYDDLLTYLKILLENPQVRERIASKFRYLMVDEYQDTNKLQGDITYLLAKDHQNVMVVGDDAQSIYGFRGATHENIMGFPKRFTHCRIIKLEENYRSSQQILDLANGIMEDMTNKYSKCLFAARAVSGEKPTILFFKDIYEEAEWIADKIMEYREQGMGLSEQAVLFRSAYISILLQAELSKRNIPFQVFGGLKFYETAHVKDVLSHLKIIANPRDELSWNRALLLIEGIGAKTAEKILSEMKPFQGVEDIAAKVLTVYDKKYKYSDALKKMGQALKKMRDDKYSTAERFGLAVDYYLPLMKDKFDDWPLRLNDLDTLRDIVAEYDSLSQMLADFSIEAPQHGVVRAQGEAHADERPLTLSTIHSSKGLEWTVVFLIGVAEGILPSSLALDEEEGEEEERRIFYVAVTRAKDQLHLSMHHEGHRGGINQFNRVSRFVDTSNVLAALERKAVIAGREESDLEEDEVGLKPVYSKDELLRRIIDDIDADI